VNYRLFRVVLRDFKYPANRENSSLFNLSSQVNSVNRNLRLPENGSRKLMKKRYGPGIEGFFYNAGTLIIISQYLAGSFVFPVGALLQWPVKRYGAWPRAVVDAAAAIPAFIRVQYDRRLALIPVGDVNIHLADFHTMVTTVADIRVKRYRSIGRNNVG
jgi:hypothetical protein